MTDERWPALDARGRDAASALRATSALRPLPAAAGDAHRGWVRPVALVAVTAVLLALLFVVVRRDHDAIDRDPNGLHYVIGDLPEGWSVVSTKDVGVDELGHERDDAFALYGTAGDPTAPTIHLYVPEREVAVDASMLFGTDDVRQFEIEGRASGCGTVVYGAPMTRCVAQLAEGGVIVTSSRLTFQQLVPVLQSMSFVHGMPYLEPPALPSGMALLRSGTTKHESAMGPDGGGGPEVTYVSYSGGQRTGAFLSVGWADQQELASAFNDAMHQVDVAGVRGYADGTDAGDMVRVVWTRDGKSFTLTFTGSEEQALAMAASVRPASATEWATLQPAPEPSTTRAVAPETTAGSADTVVPLPPATIDPTVHTLTDVRVHLSVGGRTPDDVRLSAALPDGTFGEINVIIVGTYLLFRGDNGGGSGVDLSQGDRADTVPMGDQAGYSVITTDPTAFAQLRVTRANGERYVMDVTELPNHPGIYAAVIGVPPGEMVGYDVLDAKGARVLGKP